MWYVLITTLMERYIIDMYSFSQSYLNQVVKNVTTKKRKKDFWILVTVSSEFKKNWDNEKNEKATYTMGKFICKPYIW